MQTPYQKVSETRMSDRIEKLACCSLPGSGVTRLSYTKEMESAEELVSRWMREAGMIVRRDEMGNLIGRYEGIESEGPALLIGSHLDSVVEAGKYDGILGVIAGIEVIQAMFECNIKPYYPIEVIGFCDEEGARFHTTLLGSRAISGNLCYEDLEIKDENGISVANAMKNYGLDPSIYRRAARDPQSLLGYLELHIEQGPVLEQMNQACGAVSGIAGQSRYLFHIKGLAGHAGTVPVSMRKDALVGAAQMIQTIERIALEYELVATVGKLSVKPGASNVIPGLVEGTLDIRSIDCNRKREALQRIMAESNRICERRGLICVFEKVMESPAVFCSSTMIDVIESALEGHRMKSVQLVSGAGHDAMALVANTDIGMIFVRCRGGVSHHPDEFVAIEDMKKGAAVLLDVVLKIAKADK
ncbi:hydantoinase [Mesobacillus campisalis]|uniref:Hydantoinase n=1 Tax=Mesobacillus campisalis TaxID=1408103 RepID=A0A0M2T557_9BACI|nr:allantoate amidohydrolase [Mesobacillus campisalis]KKK39950.1 hydantoinase [Mesobacillus campisalis]